VERRPPLEIDPLALASRRREQADIQLLDVREPWEREICFIAGSRHIPLAQIVDRARELSLTSPIVVYCHHGVGSLTGAATLQRLGMQNVVSLAGGIDAWSCEVDPTVPRY